VVCRANRKDDQENRKTLTDLAQEIERQSQAKRDFLASTENMS
jgi:hypothetical protein